MVVFSIVNGGFGWCRRIVRSGFYWEGTYRSLAFVNGRIGARRIGTGRKRAKVNGSKEAGRKLYG